MITAVHICSDHFKKTSVQGGLRVGCIWFGTQPLQIQITTCILTCTRAVMSQGAYDIVGANISGFRLMTLQSSGRNQRDPLKC